MTLPKETIAPSNNADSGTNWRRLALISIIYFTIKNITGVVQGAIYVIPALAISASTLDFFSTQEAYLWFALFLAVTSTSGILSFAMYRFRISDEHVEIKSGVLQRKHVNLPFWRIQNVKIEHPFYYRPFGFVIVVLDTAGSAKEEANIVAVKHEYAEALKRQVLSHQRTEQDSQVSSGDTSSQGAQQAKLDNTTVNETVINRRSIGDIVIHGFTNNRVWILLGAAAPFYDSIMDVIANWLSSKGLQLEQLVGAQTVAWWQVGLYSLAIVMMLMATMALLSVGGALFTFYNYTLTRTSDRYIRRSGLLNKQEVSMRASRIQVFSAKQDWLDRILKRVNVYFEQNATLEQSAPELMSSNRLIVPSVTEVQTADLAQEVMPGSHLYRDDYHSIHYGFMLHWIVVGVLPFTLLGLLIGGFGQHWDVILGVLVLTIVLICLIVLRWVRWGIALDKNYIYVRSGRIGLDYQCFELYKVQQIVVNQSWFMKRRRLASIKFILASGPVTVPFLPENMAWALANRGLYSVESTKRSWM